MFARLWPTLAFIVSVVAKSLEKRGGNQVIGFRTVRPYLYELYKEAGTLVTDPKSSSSDQTGPGVYLTPGIAQWAMAALVGYECAVLVDSAAWNTVNKVYVPSVATYDTCAMPLYWNVGVPNLPKWLENEGGSGYTMSNTILISLADGADGVTQFSIPPGLLNGNGGGLGITVQCANKADTDAVGLLTRAYSPVDWHAWPNIRGPVPS